VRSQHEDRDQIRDLSARYCLYFDLGMAREWAQLYTEQGEFVGAGQHLRGRPALEAFLAGLGPSTAHRISCNHIIDLDGDTADARSSVVLISRGEIVGSGRTGDRLQRVEGIWKIAMRTFVPDESTRPG
jgi:SnoaL-like domain